MSRLKATINLMNYDLDLRETRQRLRDLIIQVGINAEIRDDDDEGKHEEALPGLIAAYVAYFDKIPTVEGAAADCLFIESYGRAYMGKHYDHEEAFSNFGSSVDFHTMGPIPRSIIIEIAEASAYNDRFGVERLQKMNERKIPAL